MHAQPAASRNFSQLSVARAKAQNLYNQACSREWLQEVRSIWSRQPRRLLNLKSVQTSGKVVEQTDAGLQTVPISQIRGSANAGRANDFDINFRPLRTHTKDRWLSVAITQHRGAKLPPFC